MASKDIAAYRVTTGGATITTSQRVPTFDTTVFEDPAFELQGGGQIVKMQEAARVWARWGSGYELDAGATGARKVRTFLQWRNDGGGWNNDRGGYSYGFIPDASGVTTCEAYGASICDFADLDEFRLGQRLEDTDTPGNTLEKDNATYLEVIRLPSDFPVAIIDKRSQQAITGAWSRITDWTEVVADTGFTFDGATDEIVIANPGTYVLVAQISGRVENGTVGVDDDMNVQVRFRLNGTVISSSVCKAVQDFIATANPDDSYWSIVLELTFDTVGTDDRLEAQVIGFQNAAQTSARIQSNRAKIGIFRDTSSADRFRFRSTVAQDANAASLDIEWDEEAEKDASFTHSTTVDPDQLTMAAEADYVLAVHLPERRISSTSTARLAHKGDWYAGAGASPAKVTRGGSGAYTRGLNGGRLMDRDGLAAGLVLRAGVGAPTVRFRADKVGTANDATAQWDGGTGGLGCVFWGIRVSDWPDDPDTAIVGISESFSEAYAQATEALPVVGVSEAAPQGSTSEVQERAAIVGQAEGGAPEGPAEVSGIMNVIGLAEGGRFAPASVSIRKLVQARSLGADQGPAAVDSAIGFVSIVGRGEGSSESYGLVTAVVPLGGRSEGRGAPGVSLVAGRFALVGASEGRAEGQLFDPSLLLGFYQATSAAVRTRLRQTWAEPQGIAVHYDNLPAPPKGALWARASVVYDAFGAELLDQSSGDTTLRASGALEVVLRAPVASGTKAIRDAADQLAPLFQDQVVGGVEWLMPSLEGPTRSGSEYETVFRAPFWAYDERPDIPRVQPQISGSFQEGAEALRTHFRREVQDKLGVSVRFANLPGQTPPAGAPWIRFEVVEGVPQGDEIGVRLSGGSCQLAVSVPLGTGEAEALALVDAIDDALRAVNVQGVNLLEPSVSRGRRVGSEWRIPVAALWSLQED